MAVAEGDDDDDDDDETFRRRRGVAALLSTRRHRRAFVAVPSSPCRFCRAVVAAPLSQPSSLHDGCDVVVAVVPLAADGLRDRGSGGGLSPCRRCHRRRCTANAAGGGGRDGRRRGGGRRADELARAGAGSPRSGRAIVLSKYIK